MFERRISENAVKSVLQNGEVIEDYPSDVPYPSRLLLGWVETRPLHIVVAENEKDNQTIIITTYEPDAGRWESDFKRRKK